MLCNAKIDVIDSKEVSFSLSFLPAITFDVRFHIIKNDNWPTHVVLGRDFLISNKLTLIYSPSDSEACERLQLINEVASADICEFEVEDESIINSLSTKTDFDPKISL